MIGARGIEERSMPHVLRRPAAPSDRLRSASSRARRALVLSTLIASGWLGASPPRAQDATPSRDATGRPSIGDEFDEPTRRWREGPVRYLLSSDEDKAFRLLKRASREERKLFIDEFWAKRDPDPTTPGNAYRDLFYRRVKEANRRLNEATVPGWKTDRGKIYILIGPPDEEEWRGSGRSIRQAILWSYRSTPELSGLGPNPTLLFIRDRSGEYRLPSDVRLFSPGATLSLMFQAQAMQMRGLPEARDSAGAGYDALPDDDSPFVLQSDFYRAPVGRTLAVLTVGVRPDRLEDGAGATDGRGGNTGGPLASPEQSPPEERFEISAKLLASGSEPREYEVAGQDGHLAADSGMEADSGDYRLFQGGASVPPGNYTARFSLLDRRTGRTHALEKPIQIPDLEDSRLSLSSVTLATLLQRQPAPERGYSAPFVFGDRRVVPHPDHVLASGDDLSFHYEVYGLKIDPIEGRPEFDVEYRFLTSNSGDPDDPGSFVPLGNPIRLTRQKMPVQEYSLRLEDWGRALYRLRVTVTDTIGNRSASREVAFRVR
jgi:GWxTD domain-containing protein